MSDSLKINPAILPEEGLKLAFSENADWFKKCFPGDQLPEFALAGVDVHCLITRSGDTVYIRGNLEAKISQECSRCLEPATLTVGGDFVYTLVPEKAETEEDRELTAQDLETGYYSGDFIDLAPLICEQIVLQVPIKVLCSPDCRGLCSHCGTNLNKGSCNCRLDVVLSLIRI